MGTLHFTKYLPKGTFSLQTEHGYVLPLDCALGGLHFLSGSGMDLRLSRLLHVNEHNSDYSCPMCKNTTENNPVKPKSSRFRLLSSVSSVNQNKRSNVKRKRDDDSAPDKISVPDKISPADKKKKNQSKNKKKNEDNLP